MKKNPAFLTLLLSGAATLLALPALAEEGAHKAGLPQLDIALFPEQLFWLAVSFALLYGLMKFVALPGVERTQGNRRAIIADELTIAKKANAEARAMGAESDKALAAARAKAQETISAIKAETSQKAAEQQTAQSQRFAKDLHAAEATIAAARDKALKEVEATAHDLGAAIVEQVSGLKVAQ